MIGDIEYMRAEGLDPEPPEIPQWYNLLGAVRMAVSASKDMNTLMRAGAFEDQDLWLMRDCLTWIRNQNYWLYRAQHAYRAWREEESKRRSGS